MTSRKHLHFSLVILLFFTFRQGLSIDLRDKTTTQSSTLTTTTTNIILGPKNAVDRNISTISHTNNPRVNPWWKVDLGAIYCVRKITLVNRIDERNNIVQRLNGNVVRAGLNSDHLRNEEIGRVTISQAISGAVLDFIIPDPYVTAQYISVDKVGDGRNIVIQLTEVMVEEVVNTEQDSTSAVLHLIGSSASQSSTYQSGSNSWDAARAVDGHTQYSNPNCSRTLGNQQNPWWKVDLTSDYCISKVAIRNIDHLHHTIRLRLKDAVVRAGPSATPIDNTMCGSPVSQYQALLNDWIEFTCDPPVVARYVSVNISRQVGLILCEVKVWPCDLQPPDLALTDKPSNQSSVMNGRTARKALDMLPGEPYCSQTNEEVNPWWRVDLESNQCLGKIRVRNTASPQGSNLHAVVRAGLSQNHTDNIMCGTPVTSEQAMLNDWIEFTCDPPVLARFVSVDIPGMATLILCEVTVSTCDFKSAVNSVDFTLVTNPPLLGQSGDNDSFIAVYRGPGEITASLSFGRQLTTGGRSSDLPSGSKTVADPSSGCASTLRLRLPEVDGINRTGVFYSELINRNITTRIQTIILPREESRVHARPTQRTQIANVGEDVVLQQMRNIDSPNSDYRWRHDGSEIIESWNGLLTVTINGVKEDDEGVYSCFVSGQEDQQLHGIMRLIVRDCSAGMWGPPSCLETCRRCYNGGVCDDKSGSCLCTPGFSGENCQQAHGRNVFGQNASHNCSGSVDDLHSDACRGRLFCLPDPYGCSCAAGFTGLDCMQECEARTFGADCKQTCHCESGGTCRNDTGECNGSCNPPYFGSNCQCSTGNSVLGLVVTSGDPHQVFVTFQPDACASGYELRHQCEDIPSVNLVPQGSNYFITGMESPENYTVQVRPIYQGDVKGPEVSFPQTKKPTEPPSEVRATLMTSNSVTFSWSKLPCGARGGIITGYTYKLTEVGPASRIVIQSVTAEESVTIDGLTPETEYSFQVAAHTSAGVGPYSEVKVERTTEAPMDTPSGSAAVAGGLVASFLILIICIIVVVLVYKRRRHQAKSPSGVNGQASIDPSNAHFAPDGEQLTCMNDYTNDGMAEICPPSPVPLLNPIPSPRPRHRQPDSQRSVELGLEGAEEEVLPFVQPPPVCLEELAGYIREKDRAGNSGFEADFKTLPNGLLHPGTVARKPENRTKNRYANVIAYDHSRVVLEPLENDPHSDYINACYMYIEGYMNTDKYIASQGPNKASVKDIWRMVWQLNVDKIVMLTNPVENGKTKCQQYWPDSGCMNYADVLVQTISEEVFLDYTIRSFHINTVQSQEVSREVKQFHYKTWPDMKPPEYPTPILNFMRLVNAERNEGRTVVHCSAGIGRTGTYIALDSMLEQMHKEGQVDVLGFIYQMRQQRNKMVQTADQYRFVFDALLAASLTGDTIYEIIDFRRHVTDLKKIVEGTSETGMKKQFEVLGKLMTLKRDRERNLAHAGNLSENLNKNRFPEFYAKMSRPYLSTEVNKEDTDYINAVFFPGYHRKNMYIGTQMPMPNTIADIWRLVYDFKSTCIVMLNPMDPKDKTVCQYWPEKDSAVEFGPLVVELVETKEYNGVTGRTFTLTNQKQQSEDPRTVYQFQCQDWPAEQDVPRSLQGMLTLMDETHKWHDKEGPIVVHCIDRLGRTAVYCTVMSLLDQSNSEKAVDVFQAVFRLRTVDHNCMYSLEHYNMCYEVLQTYLDTDVIYANL